MNKEKVEKKEEFRTAVEPLRSLFSITGTSDWWRENYARTARSSMQLFSILFPGVLRIEIKNEGDK